MTSLNVRLTPWATKRITKSYGGISVDTLRQSLKDFPDTEFWTMGDMSTRAGVTLTTREALANGILRLYVCTVDNAGRSALATVAIHPSGSVNVR